MHDEGAAVDNAVMADFNGLAAGLVAVEAEALKARRAARIQFFIVTAILGLFWATVITVTVTTFALAVRSDRDRDRVVAPVASPTMVPTPTPAATATPAVPPGVPPDAQPVEGDLVLGDLDRDGLAFFFTSACTDGLMALVTTRGTVYAEVPCDQALTLDVAQRIGGQPVRIRTEDGRLLLEALFVGSFSFEPDRIWLLRR
jgi:hypothetical protein